MRNITVIIVCIPLQPGNREQTGKINDVRSQPRQAHATGSEERDNERRSTLTTKANLKCRNET
jgi:hypothetical protein